MATYFKNVGIVQLHKWRDEEKSFIKKSNLTLFNNHIGAADGIVSSKLLYV